jgi:hypothetical protein
MKPNAALDAQVPQRRISLTLNAPGAHKPADLAYGFEEQDSGNSKML